MKSAIVIFLLNILLFRYDNCGIIKGSILEEKGGKPIKGIKLRLLNEKGFKIVDSTISNNLGEFIFNNLQTNNSYRIIVNQNGFQKNEFANIKPTCEGVELKLKIEKGNFSSGCKW